jgi:hypothetical protein
MSDKENLSEEDYLKKHLGNQDSNGNNQTNSDIPTSDYKQGEDSEGIKVSDLKYFSFSVDMLPCGKFYPSGSMLMIRPAEVVEIQAYSTVDDNNFYDVVEKMNGMLQSCVRIKFPDNKIGSYLELKDQDRLYTIFLIRELTFQKGNSLTVKVPSPCGNEEEEMSIELVRDNFVFHEISDSLKKYFTPSNGTYNFKLTNKKSFELAPPTIGIQKSFSDYIIQETNADKKPNLAFLKIIPFLLANRTSISYEGIKAKLKDFKDMDEVSFQFLNSAVSKLSFGIKELKKISECGEEVRTPMKFPSGASSIFVVQDAFEAYLEE